eukprot:Skav213900  [mRNA]  locus=scaffold1439:60857:72688:- [translate_table: standard]
MAPHLAGQLPTGHRLRAALFVLYLSHSCAGDASDLQGPALTLRPRACTAPGSPQAGQLKQAAKVAKQAAKVAMAPNPYNGQQAVQQAVPTMGSQQRACSPVSAVVVNGVAQSAIQAGAVSPSGRPKLQLKPRDPRLGPPGRTQTSAPPEQPAEAQRPQSPPPPAQPAIQPDPAGGRPRLVLKPRTDGNAAPPSAPAVPSVSTMRARASVRDEALVEPAWIERCWSLHFEAKWWLAPWQPQVKRLGAMEDSKEAEPAEQLILRRKGLTTLPVDVSQCRTLRVLSASHNALVDISPVAHLSLLEELNVNHNQLTDLAPVVHCKSLRILLASNNRISEIDGLEELLSLYRLSLFQNMLADLDAVLERLQVCQNLQSLDLGGNPCFQDVAHRHVMVKGLPNLTELDGEAVANVDRQLAAEFFLCAEEFGFERPGSSAGSRPKTAPVKTLSMAGSSAASGFKADRSSRSQSRPRSSNRGSRSSSRARSNSPDPFSEVREVPVVTDDVPDSVLRFRQYVQALQLRLQTTQVDCENLVRQIQQLRQDTNEPILGVANLRQKLSKLEEDNASMHAQAEWNRKMRLELEEKEIELSQKRQALGLPELRPGTGRPGTAAAVEAVLAMTEPSTVEAFKSKCRLLKRDLEVERERTMQLRAKACSQILGREVSPPRNEF